MPTTFQHGQHPDADQLNAFVEHALPPHEQQAILAHLAVCPDCRAISYLAQPPAPELLPQPAPARTPFFTRWMLLFPTAAALACLIILTIHIHNVSVARDKATAINTAHLEQAPPPPAPQTPLTPPAPTAAQAPLSAPKTAPLPHPSAKTPLDIPATPVNGFSLDGNAATPALPKPETPAAPKSEFATEINGRVEKKSFSPASAGAISFASTAPAASAPTAPLPASPSGALHGSGLGGSAPLRSSASQYDLGLAQPQQALQAAPPPPPSSAANANSGIYGGTGQTNLNENYVAGLPASNASAPTVQTATASYDATAPAPTVPAKNETVTVTNGPAITTAPSAALRERILPKLPSNLPTVSVATTANHRLAIDTAGSLFRSEDAGVTWQSIPIQWTGRATRIAIFPPPSSRMLSGSLGAISTPAAKAQKDSSTTSTFQLTSDNGTLWTSTDGQTWKQQK